ncbi:MAG: tetratricopeptide repeat protein [Xanthobacteraceae bacterium]
MIFRPGGDNDRAIADFSDAIRLNPKRAAFYYNRGNAYGAGPDFGRALWDYYKAYAPGREGRS